MDMQTSLLKAIFSTVARNTFSSQQVYRLVGSGTKQIDAYNSCDGVTPQAEVAKRAKIDPGQMSRTITRWIEAGIVVRVGSEQFPLHVYPLTKDMIKSANAKD